MTLPLIQARKKPKFGFPWLAMLLGIVSACFAFIGIQSVTATPNAHLEVIVEGTQPLNISQETVDRALGEPVPTWKPIRILVTERQLSLREKDGLENPGADVILSTAIESGTLNLSPDDSATGAGIYLPGSKIRSLDEKARHIGYTYRDNVGLGHGPKAVAAAALYAVEVLDNGPIRSPLFWLAGTTIGFGLTVGALAFSLSRRRRREHLYRRLTTAQRQLAGVVLDLDALEATYQSTPEAQRTPGYTSTWQNILSASLELARTEDAAMEAVYSARSALKPDTAAMVKKFEIRAHRLSAQAEALTGAGSVLGGLAGSQGVLDRIVSPMAFAGRELLSRLSMQSERKVSLQRIQRFKKALQTLLGLASNNQVNTETLEAWTAAEAALHDATEAIDLALRHRRNIAPGSKEHDDVSALRVGLGLSRTGSEWVLTTLDNANTAAHAAFGPLPGADESDATAARPPRHKVEYQLSGRRYWTSIGAVIAVTSILVSAGVVFQRPQLPGWEPIGEEQLRSLTFDGDLGGIDPDEVRRFMLKQFTETVDVTVAVRSAEDYLALRPDQFDPVSHMSMDNDPRLLVDAMWRLKAEFPELLDASTGELRHDQVIIPVWRVDADRVTVPTVMTGAVMVEEHSTLGDLKYPAGYYQASENPEMTVSTIFRTLSRGLASNAYVKPEINGFWLFTLLTLSIALGITTLALAINFGGSISLKLGRFGRNAKTLRQTCSDLEALSLGLDDARLNTIAVLGPNTGNRLAESAQRIYESSLAMAWRIANDLQSRPLSGRLNSGYVADVEQLAALVKALSIQDTDVQRRTRELLASARVRMATAASHVAAAPGA